MCLAIPGEILEIFDAPAGELPTGRVSFGGVIKQVCLAYVPEARAGDYVLVHAGFAIALVDEGHAREMQDHLSRLGPDGPDGPDGPAGPAGPDRSAP